MKKILNIIKNIITYLIIIFAVCMVVFTVISVNMFDQTKRNIFGYKAFIVLSDSMSKTDFNAGDLVISKEVEDPSTLQVGDIITYQSTNSENYGEIVTHKIRELTNDAEGNPGFITYGTTTDTNDENIVTYSFVLGKYQGRLPGVGKFFQFLKTTPGYIICIFMPLFILIVMQGINSVRLFKKYKEEQQLELQAEKDKIEAERAELQKMMSEMMAMKEEMAKNSSKPKKTKKNSTEKETKNKKSSSTSNKKNNN